MTRSPHVGAQTLHLRISLIAFAVVARSEIKIFGSRGHYWQTDLYEKRDGQWQIVWSQATEAF